MEGPACGEVVAFFSRELRGRSLFRAARVRDVARPVDAGGEPHAPGLERALGEFRHDLPVVGVGQRFDVREPTADFQC
jgi:hypothetical protein